ncbi:Rh-like protein/ammonium transporter [Rhypophila decipiens]|uniref:Rh-like protein/ammonium transporter n=1 Tax=Rhypophila decipiens TaxID=261697 RepID=A0AAN7B3L1_9PEZI|nr:Rh-like protein/ammonium transporter [Rhypophila decipiens]
METFTFPAQPTPSVASSSLSVAYSDILEHPELYYQGSDLVWIMFSSAAVFLMIPALSFIYAGLGNRSFSLTLFRLPMVTAAFVGLQWVLWGYALTFSSGSLWWGGDFRTAAMRDVLARPIAVGDGGTSNGAAIPELIYILYEAMFASFTAALICGGAMHRARPARFIIFITLWSFFVYFPIARWSWSSYGWSKQLGTLDFAGGTPVHIVSGTTVAAFAIFCSIEARRKAGRNFGVSHRNESGEEVIRVIGDEAPAEHRDEAASPTKRHTGAPAEHHNEAVSPATSDTRPLADMETNTITDRSHEAQPSNVNYVVFGTALLWFGWAGFNGGSALGGNMRAVSAWTSTHIAACAGGVTGMLLIWLLKGGPVLIAHFKAASSLPRPSAGEDGEAGQGLQDHYVDYRSKESIERLSVFFFCDGAIAGLVAITPAAGYVQPWSATVIGLVSAFVVLVPLKMLAAVWLKNDPLQIFAVHTGGGLVGMALTAFFVDPVIIGLDGHSTIPHPEYNMGRRLGYQLLDGLAGMAYTFLVTILILYSMKLVTSIFPKSGSPYSDPEKSYLEDTYQATMAQYWQSGLDPLGRPRATTARSTAPAERPGSTGRDPTAPGLGSELEPEPEPEAGTASGVLAPESTGAPTSSAFTPPIHTPASASARSPAVSLAPTSELPRFAPIHDSFFRSRDPSMSPGMPPVHRST